MALIRALARPMLASVFVIGGVDAALHPAAKAPAAEEVVGELADKVPGVSNTEQLVRLDGVVKVVAGTLLAFGRLPRLSSAALAASLVPTTLAGHRFWEEQDAQKRAGQRTNFFKNVSMLGGLLIAAVDTHGKPSIAWRVRRGAADVTSTASDKVQQVAGQVAGLVHT